MSEIAFPPDSTVLDAAERRRRMSRVYVLLINLARQKRAEVERELGSQSRPAE